MYIVQYLVCFINDFRDYENRVTMVKHRVLELFSGIGGMHAALDLLQV